jgi:hypothetical protein
MRIAEMQKILAGKYICHTDCCLYKHDSFKNNTPTLNIKVGDIVDYKPNYQKIEVEITVNNEYYKLDGFFKILTFKNCFMPLAEWRDNQINSILDE